MNMHARLRRGLAPLELVLSLPLLLMIMALMVNIGTVACWKTRALSVAREKAFASRWPRDGAVNSEFDYWPSTASAGVKGNQTVPEADDSRLQMAVARGPTLAGFGVNSTLLDPSQGFIAGTSGVTRRFPMLARMGSYGLDAKAFLLDDAWQVPDMGLGRANLVRRLDVIYELPTISQLSTFETALRAFATILPSLYPLYNLKDDEDVAYHIQYGWPGLGDSHPSLLVNCTNRCSLDTAAVQTAVENLIQRIDEDDDDSPLWRLRSVPKTVAQRFLRMYQYVQKIEQSSLTPNQTLLNELQQKIDALNAFLGTLN